MILLILYLIWLFFRCMAILDSLIWPWRFRRQISAFNMVRKAKYLCL